MADWQDLSRELNLWQEKEIPATFWWRDDDAIEPTAHLTRMLDIVRCYDAPLGLAVIPTSAKPELDGLLENFPQVSVLQHGIAHINHAPEGEKSAELGAHRGHQVLLHELASGLTRIQKFQHCQPVLVPPWNRIDLAVLPKLAAIGYKGISTNICRRTPYAEPGLISINAHVDIINWRGTRGFTGTAKALDEVIEHLIERRTAQVDVSEPTGILTHHLVHDEGCWHFIEEFMDYIGNHDGAQLISISKALTP
jgi:hypothetical protein